MTDLSIQYNEELVGANHPTKDDTMNRLFYGGATPTSRDEDSKSLYEVFKKQTSDPSTGADEVAVYAKEDAGGTLRLYMRGESDGAVTEIGFPMELVDSGAVSVTTTGTTWATHTLSLGVTLESDLSQYLFRFTSGEAIRDTSGSSLGDAFYLSDLTTTQFEITLLEAASGRTGDVCYEVYKVPGKVQRGVENYVCTAPVGSKNIDITLGTAINDADRMLPILLHGGNYIPDSTNYGLLYGFEYSLPASTTFRITAMTYATGTYPIAWQVWDPLG